MCLQKISRMDQNGAYGLSTPKILQEELWKETEDCNRNGVSLEWLEMTSTLSDLLRKTEGVLLLQHA